MHQCILSSTTTTTATGTYESKLDLDVRLKVYQGRAFSCSPFHVICDEVKTYTKQLYLYDDWYIKDQFDFYDRLVDCLKTFRIDCDDDASSDDHDKMNFANMALEAAYVGDMEALHYLSNLDSISSYQMRSLSILLGIVGHFELLQWVVSKGYHQDAYTFTAAIIGGADITIMEWLKKAECSMDSYSFQMAARFSEVQILQWLLNEECPWNEHVSAEAAERGDLKMLIWLRIKHCLWNSPYTFNRAIMGCRADLITLQWLVYEDEEIINEDAILVALIRGDMDILDWLYDEKECPMNRFIDSCTFGINYVIENGANFDSLQWLFQKDGLEIGNSIEEYTYSIAIERGDLRILDLLHEKSCLKDEKHFPFAIEHDVPINVLKWMHNAQFPWDENTFYAAVNRGDWDILKWLREEDCPWGPECYKTALEEKKYDIVKWLHEENCPHDDESHELLIEELFKLCDEHKLLIAS